MEVIGRIYEIERSFIIINLILKMTPYSLLRKSFFRKPRFYGNLRKFHFRILPHKSNF